MKACIYFLFLALPICPSAQNCLPTSPVSAAYPVTENALENLFEKHKPKFTEAEFYAVKREVEQCNSALNRELDALMSQMSNLSYKYQQMLTYKDVSGLEKQIRDLEESRKKSRVELEQNLSYVKHTGIFVVLLENIDPYENKSSLIGKANAAIAPMAVEDLAGTYIRRYTKVDNFASVRDIVESFTGGEANVEKEFFNQSNYQKNYFIYVAKIGASPLKQKPVGSSPGAKALVFNLSRDSDFRSRLRSKGVSEDHIARIERDVLPYLTDVQRDNTGADSRQDDILQRGTEELRRLERDIEDAKERLNSRASKIAAICRENGYVYNPAAIDKSVTDALAGLRSQIQERSAQWTAVREREIVVKETRTFIEGSPAHHLALEVLNSCKQLEQMGKVERIMQITEVSDLDLTRYEANRKLAVYRSPQRLWAYPIPMDDNSFKLAVLLQFRITGVETDDGGKNPVPVRTWTKKFDYEPDMVFVEGGTFSMGCTAEQGSDCYDSESPAHQVKLSSYFVGKHEVTQAQWQAVMGGNPSYFSGCAQCPVEKVSWDDAQEYLRKLNEKTGGKYRLLTEAEWEYAARGGAQAKPWKYAGGNGIDDVAWYYSNSGNKTQPVGQKEANELGLFDMSGNVWEWCSDWYGPYPSGTQENPTGPSSGSSRVVRGGSWYGVARLCRVSFRADYSPGGRSADFGFRVASSP